VRILKCPKCGNTKTKTVWVKDKGDFTVRSRYCSQCKEKFQTKEMTDVGWNYKIRYNKLKKEIKKILEKS